MKLRDWLYENSVSVKYFSQCVEVDRSYIHRLMGGKVKPSEKLMEKIREVTENSVGYSHELIDTRVPRKKIKQFSSPFS